MSIVVNSNLASLTVRRHLEESSAQLRTALERLSSGVRINNAYDDAAGLAIADKLRRDSRIAAQAIRNTNDGLSALAIAEKALGEETAILVRLSELASQSATGLISDAQRSAIQAEFAALLSEIDRISVTTTFNGVRLLSAGTTFTLHVGLDDTPASQIAFSTVDGSVAGVLGVSPGSIAVSGQGAAQSSLGILTSGIAAVAQLRATIGAYESRLLTAIANLRVASETFSTAESRIRDSDIAAETAALARARILQNTGVAVLALANLHPAVALALLR